MTQIVNCPKCSSAVSVDSAQAGMRLQCPNCLGSFLAPAVSAGAGATAEDEDWLSLNEEAAAPAPTVAAASSGSGDEAVDDVELVDDSDSTSSDDDDNPFANLQPVPTRQGPQSGSLPSGESLPVGPANDESFRVKCSVCGSILYAKPSQSGKMIKCSDCFTEIRVPKPPKKQDYKPNLETAATFQLADSPHLKHPDDPYKKSADELLREAEIEPSEDDLTPAYDAPSVLGWFKTVFGIFIDPGVILHFGGLCLILSLPAALTYAYPIFAIGMFPLALMGTTLTVCCAFAIMMGVANENDRIEDWPTVDPTSWFDSLGLVIAATAFAVMPAYVIAQAIGAEIVLRIGMIMFSVYVVFPIVLLSMLDMQSILSPFSVSVGKSITQCQEDWGAFYFSAGILFAILFMFFNMAFYTPASVAVGVALSIAVVFLYFAMLGRLAIAIGEVVELTSLDQDSDDDEEDDAE